MRKISSGLHHDETIAYLEPAAGEGFILMFTVATIGFVKRRSVAVGEVLLDFCQRHLLGIRTKSTNRGITSRRELGP